MKVKLIQIDEIDRGILENLFHYYIYEMSGFLDLTPSSEGHFGFSKSQFDIYWESEGHQPYFIYVDEEIAGFVLLRKYPSMRAVTDVEQFFVLRKFNGKGVGKEAFKQITLLTPGKWQIRILFENTNGLQFWKSAISNVVGQDFILSEDIDVDLRMFFIRFEVGSY